ncbi:MAG TPA: hypothetical protein DIW86_00275, partial [Pseudomonas sp.]|nr:hypothetical protein [Pseudomonas sp.]
MAWVSVLFLLLEQMLSLTFCGKLARLGGRCKLPLVGLWGHIRYWGMAAYGFALTATHFGKAP